MIENNSFTEYAEELKCAVRGWEMALKEEYENCQKARNLEWESNISIEKIKAKIKKLQEEIAEALKDARIEKEKLERENHDR